MNNIMPDYTALNSQLTSLIKDVPHTISNPANASALIYGALEDVNWVGFYIFEDGRLVLGPFQGKPACIEIPVGKGVCGKAFADNAALCVPDVHLFPGHIACDGASRSEIVVPLRNNLGEPVAVLDVDSPKKDRFSKEDADGIALLAKTIEENVFDR